MATPWPFCVALSPTTQPVSLVVHWHMRLYCCALSFQNLVSGDLASSRADRVSTLKMNIKVPLLIPLFLEHLESGPGPRLGHVCWLGARAAITILGAEGWKTNTVGHCCSSIVDNSGKNNCQDFSGTFAARLYNSCKHAHTPGQRMWLSPGPGLDSKCSETVEVRCSCLELKLNTLSAWDSHWWNKIKKSYRECSNITRACQLPYKMAKGSLGRQEKSAPWESFTHIAWLTMICLNH